MIKLSDYVIKRLEETGTKHMFMLPGGGAMHLNDSLGKSEKIQFICTQHEQAASIAAEAYARVTNKPGLLMVTTGPGGTNALTGVSGAFLESTPMIVISGQVKRADMIHTPGLRQQGMQELDIISVVKPITKYAAVVEEPNTIRYHIEKAMYEAVSGKPGPVWLDIPLDVQATMIDEDALMGYEIPHFLPKRDVERQAIRIIEEINKSERPVLLAGNGIRLAGANEEFLELLSELNIPVLTTWNGIDLVEEEHPLYFGRPGGLGHRYANFIQQNSDLFFSLGARLNLLQTGYNFEGFAREALKIMVDIDSSELSKTNVRPDLAICADAKELICAILRNKDKIEKKERREWFDYCHKMKDKYPLVPASYWEQKELVNTYCLLETISKYMTSEDVYVSGSSGSCIDVSMQTFKVKKGQRAFCTKGLASMGYGLPSSIGAALASGKKVVGVNGDGGFVMNIQELETIHRLNLPIKIFVLRNRGYGAIKATQTNIFAGHLVACDETSNLSIPNIGKVAEAYGLKTLAIENMQELDSKVKEAIDYEGPVIIDVFTPIGLTASPKQVSYKRSDGQMESKPLEYMNPPLSEEEMKENMIIKMFEEQ